ncbi:hypothetical protein Tco_0895867 [Tanacetum coccineum]|uniref:Uncharacterized protein n=1 Tax=Tanacetum coccineum TaxID=301880 RepID=A0ABQ5CFT6_9ASTR
MLTIHDDEEEEGSARDEFLRLKREEKRKGDRGDSGYTPPTPIRSTRTHIAPLSKDKTRQKADVAAMIAEAIQKERENIRAEITLQKECENIRAEITLQDDEKLRNDDLSIWWSLKIKFEKSTPSATPCRTIVVRIRDHEDHHDDDARPEGERSKKYTLSLRKYHAVPFPEQLYRRNELQNWAKQDNIRRQKEQRDKPEEVYSKSKIVEVIKTSYELGHEHKFITKIVVRRANEKIDPITESYYKHLKKNDIEYLYLLCIYGKVKDYRETGLIVRLYQKHYHLGKCL